MIGRYHVLLVLGGRHICLETMVECHLDPCDLNSWSCTPLREIVSLGIFPCGLFRFGNLAFPSCVKTLELIA